MLATNTELDERAVRILVMATDAPEAEYRQPLTRCEGDLPAALTVMLSGTRRLLRGKRWPLAAGCGRRCGR